MNVQEWLFLISFVVLLIYLFYITVDIRIFLRTSMRSSFLHAVGATITCVGIEGAILTFAVADVRKGGIIVWIVPVLFIIIAIFGKIFEVRGELSMFTADSGMWDEIRKKTTFWQRFLGNVPVIEKNSVPPTFKRKSLFIFAISLIILGVLTLPLYYLMLRSYDYVFLFILTGPVFIVICGILLLIFIKKNKL